MSSTTPHSVKCTRPPIGSRPPDFPALRANLSRFVRGRLSAPCISSATALAPSRTARTLGQPQILLRKQRGVSVARAAETPTADAAREDALGGVPQAAGPERAGVCRQARRACAEGQRIVRGRTAITAETAWMLARATDTAGRRSVRGEARPFRPRTVGPRSNAHVDGTSDRHAGDGGVQPSVNRI